jgi:hypothetical protein
MEGKVKLDAAVQRGGGTSSRNLNAVRCGYADAATTK